MILGPLLFFVIGTLISLVLGVLVGEISFQHDKRHRIGTPQTAHQFRQERFKAEREDLATWENTLREACGYVSLDVVRKVMEAYAKGRITSGDMVRWLDSHRLPPAEDQALRDEVASRQRWDQKIRPHQYSHDVYEAAYKPNETHAAVFERHAELVAAIDRGEITRRQALAQFINIKLPAMSENEQFELAGAIFPQTVYPTNVDNDKGQHGQIDMTQRIRQTLLDVYKQPPVMLGKE